MRKELGRLAARPDDRIDLSDIPEVPDWSDGVVGKFYRPIKKPISIRVDADVLAWFRTQGGKYQAVMNEALREYMARQRDSFRHEKLKKRA